jgi:hypothetical protein
MPRELMNYKPGKSAEKNFPSRGVRFAGSGYFAGRGNFF